MLAFSETEHVALFGLAGVIATAGFTLLGVVYQARKTRRATMDELDTGNGHTAGEALSRLETVAWQHEQRLDAIDMKLGDGREAIGEITQKVDQHLAETRPLRDWAVEQIEAEHLADKERGTDV